MADAPEHAGPHPDLAGHVLGTLEPDVAAGFSAHLRSCGRCQRELADLAWLPDRLAQVLPAPVLPAALRDKTLAAIAACPPVQTDRSPAGAPSAPSASSAPATRRSRWPVAALAAAVAVVVAIAALANGPASPPVRPRLVQLAAVGGSAIDARGVARLQRTPLGVVVELHLSNLGGAPPGTHFECWYVAEGDTPERPARVSAGTFRAPEDGRAVVRMVTAADPRRFSTIEVTLEATDGDPGRAGPAVLRGSRRR